MHFTERKSKLRSVLPGNCRRNEGAHQGFTSNIGSGTQKTVQEEEWKGSGTFPEPLHRFEKKEQMFRGVSFMVEIRIHTVSLYARIYTSDQHSDYYCRVDERRSRRRETDEEVNKAGTRVF